MSGVFCPLQRKHYVPKLRSPLVGRQSSLVVDVKIHMRICIDIYGLCVDINGYSRINTSLSYLYTCPLNTPCGFRGLE